jgi:hypothetical protein
MIKNPQVLFIFCLAFVSTRFFEAQFINEHIMNYLYYAFVLGAIILSVPSLFPKRKDFVLPVQLIILSMLISIQMAHMSWGESYIKSIIGTLPYILWIFFFYLLDQKIPIKIIEKIIVIYGMVYIVLYLYQFAHNNIVLFGISEEYEESRGIVRIIFPGAGIFFLSIFLSINKLTTQDDNKWFWLVLAVVGVIITVMQATRQLIAGVLLLYLYHFIKGQKIHRIVIILAIFIGVMLYISHSDNAIINGIIETQNVTSQEGKDNIRIIAGTYFLTEFSPNNISRIFGNGVPYTSNSNYGSYVSNLGDQGFYFSDVGIIGLYVMFGILSVFAYILIWIKSFILPITDEFMYVKYYLWFLLFTSLTSYNVYHTGYLLATVFSLYIFQTNYKGKGIKARTVQF